MDTLNTPDDDPPYCPVKDTSLLKKYEIPVHHLDFNYVENCTNGKELEKILHILLSCEEGYYPQLIKSTEKRLNVILPNSKYLRRVTPVLNKNLLNKEELSDLSQDLKEWLVDVNKNDDELGKAHKSKAIDLPDVRKATANKPTSNKKDVKRIKSTDYASWDKYDPDTELLKMDIEAEKLKKEIESSTKPIENKSRTIKFSDFQTKTEAEFEANREKEKGNEFFKANEYRLALLHYTNSINFNPNCTNYNNRAITNMKLKKYEDAIKDCINALKYEPFNIKANLRLAQSYELVKNYNEAIKAAEKIVAVDPNNNFAQNLINRLNNELNVNHSKITTRMKIEEIQPAKNKIKYQTKSKHNNAKQKHFTKSIMKSPQKRDQILLPIPGPSHMSEPYYIMVENKDPEIIKTQEFIINNSGQQLLYFTNSDADDEPDCLEIHVRKPDSKYNDRWNEYSKENIPENAKTVKTNIKHKKLNRNKSNHLPLIKEEVNENDSESDYVLIGTDESRKLFIEEMEDEKSNEGRFKKYGIDEKLQTLSICELDQIEENVTECFDINNEIDRSNNFVCNEKEVNIIVETNSIESIINTDELDIKEEKEFQNRIEIPERNAIEELNENSYIFSNNQPINFMPDNGGGGEPHPTQSNDPNIDIEEVHMPFSFLRMWKSVIRDRSYTKHATILQNLDFNRLNEVIGYKLDGTMLSDIIHTLYLHFTVPNEITRVHSLLENLATLSRFNICALFLSSADKSRVQCLFQFLEQHGKPLSSETKTLYI